ncbi:MAG: AAA family ATPase [Planctomycetota bacterium]
MELGVKFVVIDNIYSLWHDLDTNDAKAWSATNQWLMRLRSKGVCVMFLHHTNRNSEQL